MRWQWVAIGVIVAVVLLPMWFVALHGEPPAAQVGIDGTVSTITPLAGFVDTPNKLSPSQVGVIIWAALLAFVAVLAGVHRFMNAAVRPNGDAATDGGSVESSLWLTTENRWVVEYHEATESTSGIVVMGALTVLAIVFAALFTGEYLTLARTQYFGVYAAGMFLSLAGLTGAYYAWFMPHVEVAERRRHE